MRDGVISWYRQFLPITEKTPRITLGEGNTPLIRADRLAGEVGFKGQLYLKFEGQNPTGSFKDRGMVVAVAKAVEEGAKMLVCASTGNTASSAAAYGAAAGLPVVVLVPKGGVALGKLAQIGMYGAQVLELDSTFDKCQDIARELVAKYPEIALVNSINPYRLEGQKTAAFEICDYLLEAIFQKQPGISKPFPDCHFIPVGNAGNITAYWMGYKKWQESRIAFRITNLIQYGQSTNSEDARKLIFEVEGEYLRLPKMMGYQAAGAAPIVLGHPVAKPQTFASAIRVGNPANWQGAVTARDESGGKIDSVTDDEIQAAYEMIPRLTGIFCEPASAAAVAGLIKALRQGDIKNTEDTVVVCTLTGHGLKDQDSATAGTAKPINVEANLEAVEKVLSF